LQPYDNSYTGAGLSAPKVKVGSQLYYLISDKENMSLQQVSSPDVTPYVYPYNVMSGINPVENEYYEPCIEVTINYDGGDSAVMVMVFESENERNQILSQIQNSAAGPVSGDNYGQDIGFQDNYDSTGYHKSDPYEQNSGGFETRDDYESQYSGSESYNSGDRQTFDEYKYSQGGLSLVEKIKGFLRYPGETFESVSSDELMSGIIYTALMLVLFSVVNVLFSAVIASALAPDNAIYGVLLNEIPELIRLVLEYFIFGALCIMVYGLLVFLMTKITRQEFHLTESLQTTFYSTTSLGTLGLIPLFGLFIAPVWMVFLQYKGLHDGLNADKKWALLSAIVPALIMFFLLYYVIISGEVVFI